MTQNISIAIRLHYDLIRPWRGSINTTTTIPVRRIMNYRLRGELQVPGDKSISHRSIMLGSLAKGTTVVDGFLPGEDCLSTIDCFRAMGILIEQNQTHLQIRGHGLYGLKPPTTILNCNNSGTTTRLLSGMLCGQIFESVITGDASIQNRPMGRIIQPLSQMGADIVSLRENDKAPLQIRPAKLHGIHYQSPVASAQLKSAILLAGLYAEGGTSVTEPALSRNHTEIMLRTFGVDVVQEKNTASLSGNPTLYAQHIDVPGDISSAAFFLAGASILPNSEIYLKKVGINPTRDGILRILKQMGADFEIFPYGEQMQYMDKDGLFHPHSHLDTEPVADILIRSSKLRGIEIGGEIIPTLIDEIPMIAALATLAEGTTVIKDSAELKVKESNRIRAMVTDLTKLGADVVETEDGMIIHGGKTLHGGIVHSYYDHRIAMTFAILRLAIKENVAITDTNCVNISYPNFFEDLKSLIR